MVEWCEEKIKDLYEYSSGLSISSNWIWTGFPFLSFSTIFNNYTVPEELTDFVESSEKDRKTCSIKKWDVFLTRTSETVEELAMSCVALKDYPNATFNGFSKRLRPKTDKISPIYAAYFFRSPFFRSQAISMSSLITRASLNETMMNHFIIRYPKDKSIQEKIWTLLFNYDELIKNNDKRVTLLENFAETIYKQRFLRLNFPWHENINLKDAKPKWWKFWEHYKKIPINWKYWSLSELWEFIRWKNITAEKMEKWNIPVISAWINPSWFHNKANVFWYSVTASASWANAWYIKYNLEDIRCADASYYNNQNNVRFIYNSLNFIRPVISNLQVWSAQPHVYPKDLNKLSIIIPTNNMIEKFENLVTPIYMEIKQLRQKNRKLITQRDLLLPRLMSWKLKFK